MWEEFERYFAKYPAQLKVAQLLLEKGFQIREDGKVVSGNIEIPHTQIAKDIGVDRRVVDVTTSRILKHPRLKKLFANLGSIAFLRDVANELGLGVIVIVADDPKQPGILAKVATKVAERNISIRQATSDDPYLMYEPELTIITDVPVPGELVAELSKIPGVKSVTIY